MTCLQSLKIVCARWNLKLTRPAAKEILVARQKRAEAQKKVHEVMSGLNDRSAFATFDRMEQKVMEIEARRMRGGIKK